MSESSEEKVVEQVAPAKASVPILPLILAVVFAVVAATAVIGGGLFWAVKTNHLPLAGVTKVVEVPVEVPVVQKEAKTKLVALEPMLVNLADPDGHSYLRISLTLKVEDPPPAKDAKAKEEAPAKGPPKNEFEAEERDTALGILGKQKSPELLGEDGKERLKKDLVDGFKLQVPDAKVQDVLITEFLVQR
jgi:flagellar FliL protein